MHSLLLIATALLAGLAMSRLAKLLKLPAVTGYLVAGIIIGPCCLGLLNISGLGFTSLAELKSLDILSETALGFIAFSIGNEFRLAQLKQIGKAATIVGIVQAVVATIVTDIALILIHLARPDLVTVPVAITLGAIASATAPAATLMVVRQYKAKGELTSILLPVVALDDAVGLVIFAVSFGVAKALKSGSVDVISVVVEPLVEICCSLALGAVMGLLLTFAERFFHSNSKRMSLSVAFVFITVSIAMNKFTVWGVNVSFSSLLVCMMLGTVFCNCCDFSPELMDKTERWTAPLNILFFVLSGAELDLTVFKSIAVVGVGVAYIIARSVGKYIGANESCRLAKCSPNVRKYLGVTLLPQAGVALGMSLTVESIGAEGVFIRNIVLFAVLVYELFGPLLTKIALTKAGDISAEGATDARDHKPYKPSKQRA